MTKPSIKRCVLYTHKSSEEGLEQAFNSLDAQREACAAYVKSQASEGWRALPDRYDDGGISGATMERPALKRLLADIAAGQIDVVVVYKIDRLTRSLADFARMVEIFDAHGVSFVSVTQAFNTTSSMGRLTLNVLLSFAQFEREVTGERIRDKIAASKAKGMWMGGTLPLGDDTPAPGSRALEVNAAEAETVRSIFTSYLELGSVHELERRLDEGGIRSKSRVTAKGRTLGGKPFSRGALFHLLRNRTYLGMTLHRDHAHPGQHPAIVGADLFEAVRRQLDANPRRMGTANSDPQTAALVGRIFDAAGAPMSPTSSRGARGKTYRYTVSAPLQQGRRSGDAEDGVVGRVPAASFEGRLSEILRRFLHGLGAEPLDLLRRVEVHRDFIRLTLPAEHLATIRAHIDGDEMVERDPTNRAACRLIIPFSIAIRGGRTLISGGGKPVARPDPKLIAALREAHAMLRRDARGLPMLDASPESSYRRRLVRLAFLAPDLQRAILEGRQPHGLTISALLAHDIPLGWQDQEQLWAARSAANNAARCRRGIEENGSSRAMD
ncbi:recombinase family protein [Acuticoccus sp. MNP-M23]|uniref:recombinase family protein n=1 Tax=Acuticoccus sp. MNP-M23 TaxID=3072793 RepID=UPI002816712F|nr:recombinase family protein [Acuticoccus sp. MNP-M23]WMS45034.1 recombinase family protein [Acuticoccus sp. MNP-M23]